MELNMTTKLKETIFLVEDDFDFREIVADSILEAFAVQVVTAETGLIALKLIDEGLKPDLVITDYRMPEMNGLDFARELVKKGYNKPIIFLSGVNDPELLKHAFGLGSFDFASKPLDKAFFETVENALRINRMGWHEPKKKAI
jgi:two-component system response regulator YesN